MLMGFDLFFLLEISVDEVANNGENRAVIEFLCAAGGCPDTVNAFVTEGTEIN